MVSVIIPVYNSSATIIEALESVRAQSFADYEVIVVDDCSTDNTVELARNWLSEHFPPSSCNPSPFTLCLLSSNSGPAGARNAGIRQAAGELIAFLDADDVWVPAKLEVQMRLVASHPDVGLWCGLVQGFTGSVPPCAQGILDAGVTELTPISLADLAARNPVATSSVLVKREAVIEAGLFDPQFRGPEDYDLWLRIIARCRAIRIGAVLSGYRQVPNSLSLDDRRFLPEVLRVLEKAYSPRGVFGSRRGYARAAAYQCLCAAWSASERGDLDHAIRTFLRSNILWPWPLRGVTSTRGERLKIVYCIARAVWRRLARYRSGPR